MTAVSGGSRKLDSSSGDRRVGPTSPNEKRLRPTLGAACGYARPTGGSSRPPEGDMAQITRSMASGHVTAAPDKVRGPDHAGHRALPLGNAALISASTDCGWIEREVAEGQEADRPVVVARRQPAHRPGTHQLDRRGDLIVRRDGRQVSLAADLSERRLRAIMAVGHAADGDVAVGDEAAHGLTLRDDDGADAPVPHRGRRLLDRGRGRQRHRLGRHHIVHRSDGADFRVRAMMTPLLPPADSVRPANACGAIAVPADLVRTRRARRAWTGRHDASAAGLIVELGAPCEHLVVILGTGHRRGRAHRWGGHPARCVAEGVDGPGWVLGDGGFFLVMPAVAAREVPRRHRAWGPTWHEP